MELSPSAPNRPRQPALAPSRAVLAQRPCGGARSPCGRARSQSGFTLAEVALAMAIFSFGLVSMLGLLSIGLKSTRRANLQTAAVNLLSTISADIRSATVTPDPNEADDLTFETPRLKIRATYKDDSQIVSLNSATELVLTEACTDVATTLATELGTLKTFRVALSAPLEKGVPALRVVISWPSNIPKTVQPEGSIDTLIPLPRKSAP